MFPEGLCKGWKRAFPLSCGSWSSHWDLLFLQPHFSHKVTTAWKEKKKKKIKKDQSKEIARGKKNRWFVFFSSFKKGKKVGKSLWLTDFLRGG